MIQSGKTKNKSSNKKFVLYGCVVLLGLFLIVFSYVKIGALSYSDGERTGVIAKFSHKGLLIKTWEGELNMGGIEQGGITANWEFSVDDASVVEKIKEAQRAGGRWSLMYRQQFMKQSWKGSTAYFITDIKKVGN